MSPRRLEAWFLVALMAIGSVMLWIVVPVGWLWFVSHVVSSNQPSMGAYLLIIVGIGVSVVIIGKILGMLDRRWARVTGVAGGQRVERAWMKSLRGSRGSTHRQTILDVVMFISVAIALVAFGIWFFLFAGSSLPS